MKLCKDDIVGRDDIMVLVEGGCGLPFDMALISLSRLREVVKEFKKQNCANVIEINDLVDELFGGVLEDV